MIVFEFCQKEYENMNSLSQDVQVFWAVVVAAAWAAASLQAWLTVQRYLRFETNVAVKILADCSSPFPAVTICNYDALGV